MITEILATQIIASTTTFTMLVWLFFCPYDGKEFENYNKSRRLFMVSLVILLMQYLVNMKFHFRATNVEYGVASNLFFYTPASYTFMLGMLNLQRAGNLKASKIRHGIATTLFSYVLLFAGIYVEEGRYQPIFNIACSAILFLNQTYFSIQLLSDYKHTKSKIDEYFSFPAEAHTRWMMRTNMLAIVAFLLLPIVIHFNRVLTIYSGFFWLAMIYYVAGFTYYGKYVHIVDESFEDDETEEEKPTTVAQGTATEKQEKNEEQQKTENVLQQRLDAWIATDNYCDNDVNIVQLAQQLQTNRTTLSRHINRVKGKNFREFINELRIEKAKSIMKENPQATVEEVSTLCGFSTRKYFDQIFSAHENMTAAEWRKRQG